MPTITIGTGNYPSYEDVAGADDHLAADVMRADAWAALEDDPKKRALVSATRMMVALPWCDEVPDPEDDQASPIPEVCAELAADLAANPKLFADATGNSNVKSVRAGSTGVEFFSPVEGGPPIPRSLWDRLVAADLVCLGASTSFGSEGSYASGTCSDDRPTWGRWPWDWPIACEDYDG